ncbi:MAG: type II 3-dehydroquinate dehydratase [Bacteriovorax sp.]|jgi:3-dehydroquinate dehydratase-2
MTTSRKFLVINGPNLNMLGQREPEIYGKLTLAEIIKYTETKLAGQNCECTWFQSNVEGEIVSRIQELTKQDFSALVINPGAYAHTSVAILDALHILKLPVIEVHLTNTHRREEFRQTKLTAKASTIIMEGLGKNAYLMAIQSQLL